MGGKELSSHLVYSGLAFIHTQLSQHNALLASVPSILSLALRNDKKCMELLTFEHRAGTECPSSLAGCRARSPLG